ncbi:hypothetical protein K4A83_04445 [Spirulina subsalsa FACHB-351]|uniref:Zinc-finger domain-containing protein n=1 Tax=Spirulina subsalsa FACHB-351 TaxID=234711 RepID=A0ABT3L212_9CYAN|nr:hypothetical protein [Spirulina subsalsa]MCW6035524.1 hypothetical protein [Spirulina subsalsa FACHB-351]
MDTRQRDRFELISAYLDGEANPAERKRVQQWLDTDPECQRLYRRLLKLRNGIQSLPTPAPAQSAETLANQVIAKVRQRERHRAFVWGGSAIAALVVGAVSTLLPGEGAFAPRMAWNRLAEPGQTEELMIALNQPLVEIPVDSQALMIPLDRPLVELHKPTVASPSYPY